MEYKFKAWHKDLKIMSEINDDGDFVFMRDDERLCSDYSLWHAIQSDRVEVLQYTGIRTLTG